MTAEVHSIQDHLTRGSSPSKNQITANEAMTILEEASAMMVSAFRDIQDVMLSAPTEQDELFNLLRNDCANTAQTSADVWEAFRVRVKFMQTRREKLGA